MQFFKANDLQLNVLAFDTSSAMNTVAVGKINVPSIADADINSKDLDNNKKVSSKKTRSGVYGAGEAICAINTQAPRKHMELLFPYIQKCLDDSKLTIHDLDAIVVGIGPGSFSGNRLGVTTARSLAGTLEVPLIGIPTTENLIGRLVSDLITGAVGGAQIKKDLTDVRDGFRVVALIDGKMDEIYFQQAIIDLSGIDLSRHDLSNVISFTDTPAVSKRSLLTDVIKDGSDLIIIGDGTSFYEQFIKEEFPRAVKLKKTYDMPDAAIYFDLLVGRVIEHDPRSWENVFPLYLRLSQAEENYLLNGGKSRARGDGKVSGKSKATDLEQGSIAASDLKGKRP